MGDLRKTPPCSPAQAVVRAREIAALPFTRYRLGTGGRDPHAALPWTGQPPAADCVGFVMWALGVDRYQPWVPTGMIHSYGGWMNCDSALADAQGPGVVWELVDKPQPGDLVVYGRRPGGGHGHVGIITECLVDTSTWTANLWRRSYPMRWRFLRKLKVVDCGASKARARVGRAVQEVTAAYAWNKPDARFIRLRRPS